MYTKEMADAFHAIKTPEGFGVTIIDNEDFITVRIDPQDLLNLNDTQKEKIVNYINDVKKALEENKAIVLISREAI
jgi:hypothetical protein